MWVLQYNTVVLLLQVFWNLWHRKRHHMASHLYLSRTNLWDDVCGICKSIRTKAKTDLSFIHSSEKNQILRSEWMRILRILRLYSVNSCLQSSHWSMYIIFFLPPCSEKLVDTRQFRKFSSMLLIIGHVGGCYLRWWLLETGYTHLLGKFKQPSHIE